MTDAKLKTTIGKGHGLVDNLCDELFHRLVDGQPVGQVVVVGILTPTEAKQWHTKDGTQRSVTFDVPRLEPVPPGAIDGLPISAEDLRLAIVRLGEQRLSPAARRQLPIDFALLADEEKRLTLVERIEAWANEKNIAGKDLEDDWRDYHGVGHGGSAAGDYHKGSIVHLTEYAQAKGVITDPTAEPDDDTSDEDDDNGGPT